MAAVNLQALELPSRPPYPAAVPAQQCLEKLHSSTHYVQVAYTACLDVREQTIRSRTYPRSTITCPNVGMLYIPKIDCHIGKHWRAVACLFHADDQSQSTFISSAYSGESAIMLAVLGAVATFHTSRGH